jgi:uncharacterized membrane protein YjfL (UPF0719 family)
MLNFILLQVQQEQLWHGVLESVLYSVIGIALAILAFKVVDWITPGELSKKIADEGNTALAILIGSLILGICIIIATALN